MSTSAGSTRPLIHRNRQVVYSVGILLLFVAMIPYSFVLERLQREQDLGEAKIGQIDSGNFSFKVFQLAGMRGIAANYLWSKALDLQKAQDWDQLRTTIDFITQLQPHFLQVWSFQGWNLAYNVSVEWDSPEDKYSWIKQGIEFLKQGVAKNRRSADLVWDTAWTYFQKLGFSDEAIVLRRLFRDDPDVGFHTYPSAENPKGEQADDNFLLAHGWFTHAVDKVDTKTGERLASDVESKVEYVDRVENRKGRPGDLHFRSMPGLSLIRYAEALEKKSIQGIEPTFKERAQVSWRRAFDNWVDKFGRHPFPMFRYEHRDVFLDDFTHPERFKKFDKDLQYWTDRWAQQTHYAFWKDRCAAEMEKDGVRARELFYEGTKAFKQAMPVEAVDRYREGLALWKKLLERHPVYRDDDMNRNDTGKIVRRYLRALQNAGMEKPKDVPFEHLLKELEGDEVPDPFDEMEMPSADMSAVPGGGLSKPNDEPPK